MQADNKLFDDFAKVMNGLAGTVAGMGREAEASARSRAREWIGGLDFVSREEFEVVKAMAVAARDEADALKARLDALEAKQQGGAPDRGRILIGVILSDGLPAVSGGAAIHSFRCATACSETVTGATCSGLVLFAGQRNA